MKRSILVNLALCCGVFLTPWVHASEALRPCTTASPPFDQLAQLVLAPGVQNPPQVQLCHRTGNAAKHYQGSRTDKTIEELRKFINETRQSTPKHLTSQQADAMITEANRLINQFSNGEITMGQVSGGVYSFATKVPAANSIVTLKFAGGDQVRQTTSDANGLFSFTNLPLTGLFVVSAQDTGGAMGSTMESLLDTQPKVSVLVYVDQLGNGQISGQISQGGASAPGVFVTAIFPETKRQYVTTSDAAGYYQFSGLRTDGTVILIASDNASGGSGSFSSFLTPSSPTRTVNLSLHVPTVIQPELANPSFGAGLEGWTTQGPVQIIERSQAFSVPN